MTFGGETIGSVAKQSLGLDLASVSFGQAAGTGGGYGIVDPPLSPVPSLALAGVSWMTNAASANYHRDFPIRVLRYGFRDGRLVALRVSISVFADANDANGFGTKVFDERRKQLLEIHDELIKASPSHRLNFDDASFRIQCHVMCGPERESLFLLEIQITPVEKKQAR